MASEFHATYERGVLKLDAPLFLPEQARVTGVVIGVVAPDGKDQMPFAAISDAEFERMLDDFPVRGCQPLPDDFSRADIYLDHD